jgi:excinuclease ABC subunit A
MPISEFSPKQKDIILYGGKPDDKMSLSYYNAKGELRSYSTSFEGVIPHLQRRYKDTSNIDKYDEIDKYMSARTCPACGGHRLRPEALAVTVAGMGIHQAGNLSITDALAWFEGLGAVDGEISPKTALTERDLLIATPILKEITARLQFMRNVGLDYLTLSRAANTLSGGEAQRIRLATQIGSQLMTF